jgi:hypothetical protein
MQFLRVFGVTGLHAIVVWAILAPFWILLVYHLLLPVFREMTRVRVTVLPKASDSKPAGQDEPPPVP